MIWWDDRLVSYDPDKDGWETQSILHATIDLDDEYVRDLVEEALSSRPGWSVNVLRSIENTIHPEQSVSDFHWGEYERIDWEGVHNVNLKKWNTKHPQGKLAKATPETLLLAIDDIDYFEEALCDIYEVRDMLPGSQRWILKPSITNQAIGICIFDRVETLKNALQKNPDLQEWVLQRYIERPLLVNRRKFHIRAYALCIGSLTSYVFSEMLALFAGQEYPMGSGDLENLDAHLTNTCRLEGHDNTEINEEKFVQLVSELPESLCHQGLTLNEAEKKVEQIKKDVQDIIGECFSAVSSELTFFTLPNCFELFGFDLLVDEDFNVWILEANAEPDLRQTGNRLKPLIKSLIDETINLVTGSLEVQKGMPHYTKARNKSAFPGEWIKVFDQQQRSFDAGPSGIKLHT